MTKLTIAHTPIRQDIEGRYCLNDLHRAAGGEKRHGPSYWIDSQQTQELVQELTDTGIPVSVTKGGLQQGTYVCKELVYAYAMWISPAFHLKVIRAYDSLQGHAPVPATLAVDPQEYISLLKARAELAELKLQQPRPRTYRPFSAGEKVTVRDLLQQGLTPGQIGHRIGRAASSVRHLRNRWHREGVL